VPQRGEPHLQGLRLGRVQRPGRASDSRGAPGDLRVARLARRGAGLPGPPWGGRPPGGGPRRSACGRNLSCR
jgi:hypothetical protein